MFTPEHFAKAALEIAIHNDRTGSRKLPPIFFVYAEAAGVETTKEERNGLSIPKEASSEPAHRQG